MNNNSKIILQYLQSVYKNCGKNVFEDFDVVRNVGLSNEDYIAAINELESLGYIEKWIFGLKLEVDFN